MTGAARGITVPAPGDLTDNPSIVTGGIWTFYQIKHDGTLSPHRDAANYTGYEMDYSAPEVYLGPDPLVTEGHPSYRTSEGALTARGSWGDGKWRPAAVTFQPAESGMYSWSGKVLCTDWAIYHTATTLIFGKLSNGHWVDQREIKVNYNTTLDLSTVPELRSMPVKSDELMVMVVMPTSEFGANVAYLRAVSGHELSITCLGPVNKVPDFSNIGSNPNYRSPEGEWSVRDISEEYTGLEDNFHNYRLMKWNPGFSNWQGESPLKWGHPAYRPGASVLTSAGSGSSPSSQRKSAMVFKSSRSGLFEMTGILECEDEGGSGSALNTGIEIGRFTQDAAGSYIWDQLYQATVPETLPVRTGINLGAVPALREITLNSGDMVVVVVSSPASGACTAYFNPVAANPVSIDRLPSSHNIFTDAPGEGGGNPRVDSAGNSWEVGQLLTENPAALGYYDPMSWNATLGAWEGSSIVYSTPAWYPAMSVLTSARGGGSGGVPYMRFTPARPGLYSWSGQFQIDNYSAPSFPPNGYVAFGRIYNSGTQYEELGRWNFSGDWGVDAENIPGLNGIALDAGDTLTLCVYPGWNTSFALRMRSPLGNVMIRPGSRSTAGSGLIEVPHSMPAAQTATGTVNPSYDEQGNKWQVFQIPGGDPAAVSSYVPMVWDSASYGAGKGRWRGTTMTAGGPDWCPGEFVLHAAKAGTEAEGVPCFLFTPVEPGTYSWKEAVQLTQWNWNVVGGAGTIRFGKISGTTYTSLHTQSFSNSQTPLEFNLGAIPGLQRIPLAAGEALTISLHPGYNSSPALSLNLPGAKKNLLSIRSVVGGNAVSLPVSTAMPKAVSGDNPRTEAGGVWKAFEVKNCNSDPVNSPYDPLNPIAILANYSDLNWNSAGNLWDGIQVAGDHPTWRAAEHIMTAAQSGSSLFGISAFSLTVDADGDYTWEGKVVMHNWTVNSDAGASLIFGKIHGGTYTALGSRSYSLVNNGSITVNMQELEFLSSITLAEGDSLVFAFASRYNCAVAAQLSADTGPRPLLIEKLQTSRPVDSSDLSRPHLIDASAVGVPFDKRILGQAGGLKKLPNPTETPGGAPSFAPGILVRGPVNTAEDWIWRNGVNLDLLEGGYWSRTVFNFLRNLKAENCVPLLGVSAFLAVEPPAFVMNSTQIEVLAQNAGDYVRYVNYILHHYTVSSPPHEVANPRDYAIVQSIAGGAAWKLPAQLTAPETDYVTYWEVGNEPDHTESADFNYSEVYKAIEARMREVNDEIRLLDPSVPEIKIGPALGSGYYWATRPLTMEIFEPDYEGRIDFISIHPYDELQKILVPYRALYRSLLPSPPANSFVLHNQSQLMEAGLRSLRSNRGAVFSARNRLIDQYITPMGRASEGLEVFASEYDPMLWTQAWVSDGDFGGQLPQMTMYNVLATMESLFIFRDQGYNGACMWFHDVNAPDGANPPGVPVAFLPLFQKMNKELGDRVIYQYAPVVYNGVDNGDGVRIYATKDSSTNKISVWCSNLWQERSAKVRLGIRGFPGTPSSAQVERLAPVGTTGLGSKFLTWNTVVDPKAVDWTPPEPVQIQDLSDFELDLPPATITLLLVEP
ncbi:MAG: hypothetical protein V4726_03345 [Verrucomicrobiota bacterium]